MMVCKLLPCRMTLMFISTTLLSLGIVDKCTATPLESRIKEYDSSSKSDVKDNFEDNSDEDNCSVSCQCGLLNKSKIVGGTEVDPMRKYPWHVGLFLEGYYFVCGGTIINDRWILTAAHCIVLLDHNCDKIKYSSSFPLRVVVGDHNQLLTSDDDSNTKKYSVKTYVKHPNFNCTTLNYDVALLELTEPIPFNDIIRPVCLPKDDSKTYANQTGIITGWGMTGDKESSSSYLRKVQVPLLGNDKCKGWGTVAPMKLCYDIVSDKASCMGDSGGPVHIIENNKYVQVGLVSYGHVSTCISKEFSTVTARVSTALPWIATITANGRKCN